MSVKYFSAVAVCVFIKILFFYFFQERFAEIFGDNAAAESRLAEEGFKKWLLVGMTVVTAVVAGSLFAQKRL